MKLLNRINPEIERKMIHAIFVGRLVTADELSSTMIDEPVRYIGEYQDHVQFYLKCLSDMPAEITKHFSYPNIIFTGNTKGRENRRIFNDMIQYDRLPHFQTKEKIRELLEGKLILFKLDPKPEFMYADIIKIESVDRIHDTYRFIPSPELKPGEVKQDLEQKLVYGGTPLIMKKYPHLFQVSELLYYERTLYKVSLTATPNPVGYSPIEESEVRYVQAGEAFEEMVAARVDRHLYVVDEEAYRKLDSALENQGELLQLKISERIEKQKEQKQPSPRQKWKKSNGEWEFLLHLEQKAKCEYQFHYRMQDLVSLHISAKTNMLTVIGGMPGTGKSQLAKLYGRALGLQEGKNMLMVPISPGYHEPNDLLGYLNPNTGVYNESETGLVSLLLDAENNPDELYMVIFDEMNLSQAEHWFSPFLSLLELEAESRSLILFNKNADLKASKYKSKVKVGDNLIFIGTVNYDETTKVFSDRLLDRTNVIIPEKISFRESASSYAAPTFEQSWITPPSIDKMIYRKKWVMQRGLRQLTDEELQILDELHEILTENDPQKGVSFRAAHGIADFVSNIPMDENGQLIISREKAMDLQIKQRILTKIKGPEAYAAPLIGSQIQEGSIQVLLTSDLAQSISPFNECLHLLHSKAKELMMYGYLS